MNNNNNNINSSFNKTTINGINQVASGDIINNTLDTSEKIAEYKTKPIWRSPFTMSVLTWISVVFGMLSILPLANIIKILKISLWSGSSLYKYVILLLVILIVLIFFLSLRDIAKKQTRYPLKFNFAISGYGKRITIEKIYDTKCPKCGSKMKYYNKPVEWVDVTLENGKKKRNITKRSPVLECNRNPEHFGYVDPAEEYLQ